VASTNETDFRSVRLILHRPGVASYKKAPRPLKKHLEANVGAVRVSVVAQDEQRYEGNDALDLLKAHPHWNGGDRLPGRKRSQNTNKVTNIYQITVGALENSRSFSYDANGNCLSDGIRTYHWDAENRLVSVTQGTNTYSFGYDYASRRVTEKLNGTLITQSVWDGQSLAEERNASNAVTKQFFAQGEVQSGSPFYYLRDHLGSVRELVNSSGAVQAEYTYDPYGNATTNQVSGTNVATFQYAGYYAHQGTGLDLTLYRAYDSVTGRWQSRDPIGENGGMDLYSYVENNSVNHIDAFGLSGGTGRHDYCPINKPPLPGSPGPAQYGEVLGGAACVATLPFAIPAAAVGYDAAGLAIVLNPTYQYIISSPTTQQLIWAGLSVFGISSCQQPTAPAQILPLIIKDINQNNTGNGGKNCPSK